MKLRETMKTQVEKREAQLRKSVESLLGMLLRIFTLCRSTDELLPRADVLTLNQVPLICQ